MAWNCHALTVFRQFKDNAIIPRLLFSFAAGDLTSLSPITMIAFALVIRLHKDYQTQSITRIMPFHIQADDRLIRLNCTGHITKAEAMESALQIRQVETRFRQRPDQITDLSGVVSRETDFATISSIAQERRAKVFPNAFRLAMVAPTAESLGFARMYQTLAESPQIEIRIFAALAEAESWLGLTSTTPPVPPPVFVSGVP